MVPPSVRHFSVFVKFRFTDVLFNFIYIITYLLSHKKDNAPKNVEKIALRSYCDYSDKRFTNIKNRKIS